MSQATVKDNSWTNSKEAKRLNQKTQNHNKISSHKSHKTLNHNTWIQSHQHHCHRAQQRGRNQCPQSQWL